MENKLLRHAVRLPLDAKLLDGDRVFVDKHALDFLDFIGLEGRCISDYARETPKFEFSNGKSASGSTEGLILIANRHGCAPGFENVLAEF